MCIAFYFVFSYDYFLMLTIKIFRYPDIICKTYNHCMELSLPQRAVNREPRGFLDFSTLTEWNWIN